MLFASLASRVYYDTASVSLLPRCFRHPCGDECFHQISEFEVAGCGNDDLWRSPLRFSIDPLGTVGARLIEDYRNIVLSGDKLRMAALNDLAIVLLGLDDKQQLIHKPGHSQSRAGLAERRHIENNVIEVARL